MIYSCPSCGKTYSLTEPIYRCTCGSFLELKREMFLSPDAETDIPVSGGHAQTIWRYRELLGLPPQIETVSLGEGLTPTIKREIDGIDIYLKLDFLQPTGSFKDRGASLLVGAARHMGVSEIIDDSSGNAGAAIAAYSAAAGIQCRIFVPDYTPEGKIVQIRYYNAEVVRVAGTRQDTNDAALTAAQNAYYAGHLWNPLFSHGSATIAYELSEFFIESVPPVVMVPLGGGSNIEGIYRGFRDLLRVGKIRQMPKLIGVQSTNCAPIHTAFQQGLTESSIVEIQPTIADGIAVQNPPRSRAVLQALRESGGYTISVEEKEILSALRKLSSMGIYVEPTSASVLAGWKRISLEEQQNAVLILTGSGLKETSKLSSLLKNEK